MKQQLPDPRQETLVSIEEDVDDWVLVPNSPEPPTTPDPQAGGWGTVSGVEAAHASGGYQRRGQIEPDTTPRWVWVDDLGYEVVYSSREQIQLEHAWGSGLVSYRQ